MTPLSSNKFSISRILLAVIFSLGILSNQGIAQDGEKLFKANCASCHKLDKIMIGPALAGVQDRWESQENLIRWIKNSQAYLEEGNDPYAAELFEKFNGQIMTAMPLSDEEILAVLDYIANPPEPAEPVVVEEVAEAEAGEDYSIYWISGLIILFIVIIRVLFSLSQSLRKMKDDVDGVSSTTVGFWESVTKWISNNQKSSVAIGLTILVYLLVQTWYAAKDIGVFQGYAPEQPIKFSHKIHAGDNAINCVYCHHSAEKGKNAGIPSVNVCMNCHKGISEGSLYGETEIAKIYEAAGFNTETQKYDLPEKPIKWTRIHNLPDFAYFNHSQHVIVGEQQCQTCHGSVEEFDYPMKQHAELTMGWCIDCHRKTEVKMAGNEYYDKIHQDLLEKYKDEGIEKFTVEHIGGLECAKCHY